jgi:LPXTG-motif cell wall-anchored protein
LPIVTTPVTAAPTTAAATTAPAPATAAPTTAAPTTVAPTTAAAVVAPITVEPQAEVLGIQEVAYTGSESKATGYIGFGLTLIGLSLVAATRKRKTDF